MPEKIKAQRRVGKARTKPAPAKAEGSAPREAIVQRSPVADRRELLEFLTKVLRTPIGEVTAANVICERAKPTAAGTEVAMPDKRACVEMLARLQGFLTDKSRGEPGDKVDEGIVLTEERRRVLMEKKRRAGERMKDEG